MIYGRQTILLTSMMDIWHGYTEAYKIPLCPCVFDVALGNMEDDRLYGLQVNAPYWAPTPYSACEEYCGKLLAAKLKGRRFDWKEVMERVADLVHAENPEQAMPSEKSVKNWFIRARKSRAIQGMLLSPKRYGIRTVLLLLPVIHPLDALLMTSSCVSSCCVYNCWDQCDGWVCWCEGCACRKGRKT